MPEIALPLLTLFVATLASLAAILDFFTFAPLTEIFVNRHYEFRSFSLEDCQRSGRTRIPFCGRPKMSRHERAAGSFAHSGMGDTARHSMPKYSVKRTFRTRYVSLPARIRDL